MDNVESIVVGLPMSMLQHRGEIIPFAEWVLAQGIRNMLEIGTGPGGTTTLWGRLLDFVVSIDLLSDNTIARHAELRSALPNFRGVLGDSQTQETVGVVDHLLAGRSVDLLFIDGDHRYEAVAHDFEVYRRFVKDGGWIAFHDINASDKWPDMGVPRFWNELQGEKRIFSVNADWGGIGAVTK